MATYKAWRSFKKFISALFQLAGLIMLTAGTLIVLILSGLFVASLFIRNFFRKKCCRK